jgi:hypothetical protein
MAILRACFAAALLAVAACYGPQLDPCTVHCPNNEPCPNDETCGTDLFCHAVGDTTDCRVTAMFAIQITKSGDGAGFVSDDKGMLSCTPTQTTCGARYAPNTMVTLTATATVTTDVSRFAMWSGACSGTDGTCTLTMTGDKTIGAQFDQAAELTVSFVGPGSGTVMFDLPAASCTAATGTCNRFFDLNSTVTLSATPDSGSTFFGFSSVDCPSMSLTCSETMSGPITVTAEFD